MLRVPLTGSGWSGWWGRLRLGVRAQSSNPGPEASKPCDLDQVYATPARHPPPPQIRIRRLLRRIIWVSLVAQ